MAQPKGRPTPKRADVEKARRKPLVAASGRAGAKAQRVSNASVRASMREAMKTGDERNYPPNVAGPERALVRDVVDGRRSFGWLAIPGWFVGVALTLVPSVAARTFGSLVFPIVIVVIVADAIVARRAVKAALDERWPDGTEVSRKSLLWYGTARNTQFRKQRLPRPKVWRGAPVDPA
jgi:hypothetical protein